MPVTFAIAAAVHARAGDVVSIFIVNGAAPRRADRFASLRSALSSGAAPAASSPLLFNETARAWFMTEYHAEKPAARAPGQALLYTRTPEPDLPVTQIVRGRVDETFQVQDMTYGHVDTIVTIDVIEERAIAPGDPWLPQRSG